MKIKIKPKNILIDTLVTMAAVSLIASMVIVLAGNLNVFGVKSVQFDLSSGSIFTMENFDVSTSYGEVGILGIIIGILTLAGICFLSYFFTKSDHYYCVIGMIIPFILILLPLMIKNSSIINLIGYLGMLLFVNPFYTLICFLPININVSVYLGYGIVTLLVLLSTVAGIIVNKIIIKEL